MSKKEFFLGVLFLFGSCSVQKEILRIENKDQVTVHKKISPDNYETLLDSDSYDKGMKSLNNKSKTEILFYDVLDKSYIAFSRNKKETSDSFFPQFINIEVIEEISQIDRCLWVGYDGIRLYCVTEKINRSLSNRYYYVYSISELGPVDYKEIRYFKRD